MSFFIWSPKLSKFLGDLVFTVTSNYSKNTNYKSWILISASHYTPLWKTNTAFFLHMQLLISNNVNLMVKLQIKTHDSFNNTNNLHLLHKRQPKFLIVFVKNQPHAFDKHNHARKKLRKKNFFSFTIFPQKSLKSYFVLATSFQHL